MLLFISSLRIIRIKIPLMLAIHVIQANVS